MSNIIAKKYVKAILEEFKGEDLTKLVDLLSDLAKAFKNAKFSEIIGSSTISNSQKTDFVLSMLKGQNQKVLNFFKILSQNKRLSLIPEILEDLKTKISIDKNEYGGKVYSKNEISDAQLRDLENKFSKKFDAKIKLEAVKSDYNGIKIDIEGLGVEISFSIDRLKSKMSEYILKAI